MGGFVLFCVLSPGGSYLVLTWIWAWLVALSFWINPRWAYILLLSVCRTVEALVKYLQPDVREFSNSSLNESRVCLKRVQVKDKASEKRKKGRTTFRLHSLPPNKQTNEQSNQDNAKQNKMKRNKTNKTKTRQKHVGFSDLWARLGYRHNIRVLKRRPSSVIKILHRYWKERKKERKKEKGACRRTTDNRRSTAR